MTTHAGVMLSRRFLSLIASFQTARFKKVGKRSGPLREAENDSHSFEVGQQLVLAGRHFLSAATAVMKSMHV